jgi:hypothetical protein
MDKFTNFPVLVTERLVLRDLQQSDAADVLVFRGDSIIQNYDDPIIQNGQNQQFNTLEDLSGYLANQLYLPNPGLADTHWGSESSGAAVLSGEKTGC